MDSSRTFKRNCLSPPNNDIEELSDENMDIEKEQEPPRMAGGFTTAKNQYIVDQQKKHGNNYNPKTDK